MKYASRKYIDLIQAVSSKWASWDPPHPIKVGDYGTVDKDTGRFEKDGNIYDDPAIAALSLDHQPETLAPDEKIIFTSQTENSSEFKLSPEVKIPGIAEASIKGQWKFKTGKRGALLAMAQPRSSKFSSENVLLKRLVDRPELKDKYLVTETVSCHAYSLYLSSKSDDTVSLALVATTPIPVAPLVSAGGEVGGSWWSKTGSGVFRHGCAPQGTYSFTPLFVLKQVRKKSGFPYREHAEEDNSDDWETVNTPWWPLDEDGEEEVFEDTVFE
ncbi:hypothetical protein C8F04DRAFT_1126770 [Mycena alexandri]|uniref:Uncharacterized protein n=1 Tax=Mycena alexandri TaxID=1745969 RepID=A0AAD6SEU5_9AGAR|nr:hypothetical protein C8F04DRAFT_1126770 [Mycena alexandri]